jgi:hypothetical protein
VVVVEGGGLVVEAEAGVEVVEVEISTWVHTPQSNGANFQLKTRNASLKDDKDQQQAHHKSHSNATCPLWEPQLVMDLSLSRTNKHS